MDLTSRKKAWGIDDTSWIASRHGLDSGRSITLDVSTFTKNTHYPDGFLKSGLPLGRRASDGLYVPEGAADSVADGHLLGAIHIAGTNPGETVPDRVGGALMIRGVIDCRFLPVQVSTAGRVTLGDRFRYENVQGA